MLGKIYADHNHITKMFRGWVHPRCNIWLGALDHPTWKLKAQAYLTRI